MSSATLTLMGLYQYGLNRYNMDIFEKLTLPDEIDKDVVVTTILSNGADYELINPDLLFMYDASEFFSKKWKRTFEKWVELLNAEYEPLDNYDRKEYFSESSSEYNSLSGSDSSSSSMSENNTISAFNSYSQSPASAAEAKNNVAGTTKTESSRNDNKIHDGRVHGNIGVKTTQSIWIEQADLVRDFNIYEEIYKLFAKEYLIPFTY